MPNYTPILVSSSLNLANENLFCDVTSSSTRREDLLLGKELTQKIWVLRNHLADMTPVESIEFMRDRLLRTETNEEFIVTMNS